MRKVLSIILCIMIHTTLSSQFINSKTEIKDANLKKTGNWQNVFANFYQVALKNITGDKKAFEFKSTLFALRSSANPTLLVDSEYIKKRNVFDRNLQFQGGIQLDSVYKFKGLNLGFTWAIINKRDSAILSFVGKEKEILEMRNLSFNNSLESVLINYQTSKNYDTVRAIIDTMKKYGKWDNTKLPKDFLDLFKEGERFNEITKIIRDKIEETRTKPFLTLSVNANFKNGSELFKSFDTELVYLQGLTKKGNPLELDVRLKTNVTDTTIGISTKRSLINFTGGCNVTLAATRIDHIPVIEFKPHIEYNYIANGLLPGETKKLFTANATVNIRVMKNVWLPFTLKYDVENNNFFGFLNVAFNWDAFKNK